MSSCNGEILYATQKNNNTKAPKEKFTEGVNICVWFLFSCAVIHIGIENFAKYGVIKGPFQLALDFIKYMQTYWWLYFAVLISFWLQVLLCYIIENLLIRKSVSERFGMGLHIFNSLLLYNVTALLTYVYQCSPFAGVNVTGHIFLQCFKYWSYMYTNRKHRLGLYNYKKDDEQVSDKEDQSTKTIKYPQNVTLVNLIKFATTSPILTYTPNGVRKKPRDWKKASKLIGYSIIAHYLCAFLAHQFILPEVELASEYLLKRNILSFAAIAFKLTIPIFTFWLIYYYFFYFECYMRLIGCAGGTEDVHIMDDWWNAETTTIYWCKWNIQVHTVFKDCVFIPLRNMGYSKLQASVVVCLVSGFMHEYLISVPFRTGYGLSILGMLMQIPLARISTYVYKNFNAKLGNLVFWFSFIMGEFAGVIILYYKYKCNNSLSFLQI